MHATTPKSPRIGCQYEIENNWSIAQPRVGKTWCYFKFDPSLTICTPQLVAQAKMYLQIYTRVLHLCNVIYYKMQSVQPDKICLADNRITRSCIIFYL